MEISLKSKSIVYLVMARYYNGNSSKIIGLINSDNDINALKKAQQILPKEIFSYRLQEIKVTKYCPQYHNNKSNKQNIAPRKLVDAINIFTNRLKINLQFRRNHNNKSYFIRRI